MTKFFKASDFEFNTNWAINVEPWKDSKIMFVDDVYKYPDKVYSYLSSIQAIRTHKSIRGSKNGIDFMDGQMAIDNRWDQNRKFLIEMLADAYGVPDIDPHAVPNTTNTFRLISDYPGAGNYWHPHVDGQLNFMIYMNPSHHMKAGTTLYNAANTKAKAFLKNKDTEHSNPWRTDKQFTEELCILDRFNQGVVFPGQWFHGQTITDNFFKTTTRFTEVTFI